MMMGGCCGERKEKSDVRVRRDGDLRAMEMGEMQMGKRTWKGTYMSHDNIWPRCRGQGYYLATHLLED